MLTHKVYLFVYLYIYFCEMGNTFNLYQQRFTHWRNMLTRFIFFLYLVEG